MGDGVTHRVDDRTIVVAVDGSAASDEALEWAIAEAVATGRALLLLYVLTTADELATSLLPLAGGPDAGTFGQDVLKRAARRCQESAVSHTVKLVEGTPTERLIETAADAGMLVLGGHLHDRPPPPAFESVIQGCLHRCRCPLVVVKEGSVRSDSG